MQKILIADDDETIAMLIADALEDAGFLPTVCHRGDEALGLLREQEDWALVLLDIMMPGLDGTEVLRQVRETLMCPILLVTARNRTLDTLQGFDLGADDYIAKPFVLDELVARVHAHVRREHRRPAAESRSLSFGDITLLMDRYEVLVAGEQVGLTTREFQLLAYLASNPGRVLGREEIFCAVWGSGYGDTSAVAVYIRSLRQKLGAAKGHIKTIWGLGYQLVCQREDQP